MIKILNAEPLEYSPIAESILSNIGVVISQDMDRNELIKQIGDFDILIVRLRNRIDKEILSYARKLKIIVTATTGLDHIDIVTANAKGIAILSLKGEVEFLRNIPATAEHTWGLLLSLVRKIPWAYQSVLQGIWERDQFRGYDLANRTLGIVGMGRIGEKVARYGLAFGMNVIAFDPYRTNWIEGVVSAKSLESLCIQSEILSLHVPLNSETNNMFGKTEFEHLPKDALLINTSRGSVLDEIALIEALESGHLAGAALDVISDEIKPIRNITDLLINYSKSHSNLLLTPHIGGATIDSMHATEIFMAQKVVNFVNKHLAI